jgi:ABC-type multidrug transport system fused ATPase/permease subunit
VSEKASTALAPRPQKPVKPKKIRTVLPDVWALVLPRKWTLAVGMLLIIITRLVGLSSPIATKYLIDDVIIKKHSDHLVLVVGAVALAGVIQTLCGFALAQIFARSTNRLIVELRCKVYSHVVRLPLLYHDSTKSGTLGSRIMNDVGGLQNLVGTGVLQFLGSLMTAVIALVLMFRASPLLASLALVGMAIFGTLIAINTARLKAISRERTKLFADLMGRLTESLGGIRVVKGYHAEAREDAVFANANDKLLSNFWKTLNITSGMSVTTSSLLAVMSAGVMWIGASKIIEGTLSLGSFVQFTILLGLLVSPLTQLVGFGGQLTEAMAGLERTKEILNERREDQDPERTVEVGAIEGEVTFKDVQFAYVADKPVLHDFSFTAKPGTVTALVGPSGSGKSTTIGLIAAFYKPTAGQVLIDGKDINTFRLDSYRAHIGVVLQETFLFDGTILDNVSFSRPGATREQVLEACRIARVDDFAEKLDKGYETIVGERGVKLSGGQRQRISIARAILADPKILILDEATSSLDTQSEALIQEALTYLLAGRTTFVIAHRLSTIRKADQILVVDQGRIVERGSHEALLGQKGLYFDMYSTQHHLAEDLFLAPGEGEPPPEAKPRTTAALASTGLSGGEDPQNLFPGFSQ